MKDYKKALKLIHKLGYSEEKLIESCETFIFQFASDIIGEAIASGHSDSGYLNLESGENTLHVQVVNLKGKKIERVDSYELSDIISKDKFPNRSLAALGMIEKVTKITLSDALGSLTNLVSKKMQESNKSIFAIMKADHMKYYLVEKGSTIHLSNKDVQEIFIKDIFSFE